MWSKTNGLLISWRDQLPFKHVTVKTRPIVACSAARHEGESLHASIAMTPRKADTFTFGGTFGGIMKKLVVEMWRPRWLYPDLRSPPAAPALALQRSDD